MFQYRHVYKIIQTNIKFLKYVYEKQSPNNLHIHQNCFIFRQGLLAAGDCGWSRLGWAGLGFCWDGIGLD